MYIYNYIRTYGQRSDGGGYGLWKWLRLWTYEETHLEKLSLSLFLNFRSDFILKQNLKHLFIFIFFNFNIDKQLNIYFFKLIKY